MREIKFIQPSIFCKKCHYTAFSEHPFFVIVAEYKLFFLINKRTNIYDDKSYDKKIGCFNSFFFFSTHTFSQTDICLRFLVDSCCIIKTLHIVVLPAFAHWRTQRAFLVKVARNSFQHCARCRFWWVITTTLDHLMRKP